ncbi:MAG: 23S rRNA (adenine1618-N6)-methyltransferase [Salibacteraceae bacterium]|jgi:23S rRNA (adenine1618-N6)-methyltransferase
MIPKKKIEKTANTPNKKPTVKIKASLHTRNRYTGKYDFDILMGVEPALKPLVFVNEYGNQTIDFFDPNAVLALNKALLNQFYEVKLWEIPKGYLCPPVPGRADYIHHTADLLQRNNFGTIPSGGRVNVLDIGIGANGIFSIVSALEYGWSVIGTDIDEVAISSVSKTIEANEKLTELVQVRTQENPASILRGVIQLTDKFDLTVCNPPFHSSAEEAQKGTLRKLRNLKKGAVKKPIRNFDGVSNELWCEGGEIRFITDMINQSREFSTQCFWFTTLVSKHSNLRAIHKLLRQVKATKVETIEMGQGNKSSRIVAWTFLDKSQQQEWKANRWLRTEF